MSGISSDFIQRDRRAKSLTDNDGEKCRQEDHTLLIAELIDQPSSRNAVCGHESRQEDPSVLAPPVLNAHNTRPQSRAAKTSLKNASRSACERRTSSPIDLT